MAYLTEIEQAIMKFMWKNKKHTIAKAILSRKSEAGDIVIQNFSYTTKQQQQKWHGIGTKMDRQINGTEQRTRTQTQINTIFSYQTKGTKICNGEKIASSTNGAGKTGNPYATE